VTYLVGESSGTAGFAHPGCMWPRSHRSAGSAAADTENLPCRLTAATVSAMPDDAPDAWLARPLCSLRSKQLVQWVQEIA